MSFLALECPFEIIGFISVDQSVDLQISTKIRGKKRLFSWLRKMAGGYLQFEWLVCRRHFKTCSRDVFSPGPTPIFISWTVMEKSIFEISEKWSFWALCGLFCCIFAKNTWKTCFYWNVALKSVEWFTLWSLDMKLT